MISPTRLAPFLAILLLVAPVAAEDAKPGDTIEWSKDLPTAFAKAKEAQKILMICVNAKSVSGEKEEPAAKGLREVIYKDPRIVTKSRDFVCAFLTRAGNSADYGELRALGIEGRIISPQHIFVHPDGQKVLVRREYWSHGRGESGVKALLDMMAKARNAFGGENAPPDAPEGDKPDAGDAPVPGPADPAGQDDKARAEWIQRMLKQVLEGSMEKRDAALLSLVQNDKDGDCTTPLIALLPEKKKDVPLLVALIRILGRDGLEAAALPIAEQLTHKDETVRGNAAVSLEYIGCREKKVVAALRKLADKDKDESIANHAYRALGRCGVGDSKARGILLKKAESAKSEFGSYGPCIGLAYWKGDKKAARGVEKILKKIGVPGSRRGGGTNVVKRGLVSWVLASIGDKKSGKFVREELLAKLENVKAFWVGGLTRFWDGVARACEGEEGALDGVRTGVAGFVAYAKNMGLGRYGAETNNLMDDYRKGREAAGFTPKGDGLLDNERGS